MSFYSWHLINNKYKIRNNETFVDYVSWKKCSLRHTIRIALTNFNSSFVCDKTLASSACHRKTICADQKCNKNEKRRTFRCLWAFQLQFDASLQPFLLIKESYTANIVNVIKIDRNHYFGQHNLKQTSIDKASID